MEKLEYVRDVAVEGKRVLLRVDIPPLSEPGRENGDTARIRNSLSSAQAVLKRGGSVILAGSTSQNQNGGPSSYAPVVRRLSTALGTDISFCPEPFTKDTEEALKKLAPGQIVLLENLSLYPGEENNDPALAAFLARLADVYIFDAFVSAASRTASTVSLPALFRRKAAGLVIENELKGFEKCFALPQRPLLGIVAGLRFSSRLDLIMSLSQKVDKLIIGGGVAHTFLAAQGLQVGRAVFEKDMMPRALEALGMLARRDTKVYLPVDFLVAPSASSVGLARAVPSLEIPADTMALDIGPASIALFQEVIRYSDTIFWCGSLGASENEEFAKGTQDLVEAVAASPGTKVACGESVEKNVAAMELAHKFDLISSSGESFCALVEGRRLPALTALTQ